jgi:hypothetical protein
LHHFRKKANRLSAFSALGETGRRVGEGAFGVQRSAATIPNVPFVTSVASSMLSCPTVSCTQAGAAPANSLNFFWFLEIGVPIN